MAKLKWVSEYVEAIRVERTGRDLHSKRFFLKADDGHKIRIKVLAKEMENANKSLEKLNKRAVELYLRDRPEAEWERTPEDEEILRKSKENSSGAAGRFLESGFQPSKSSLGDYPEDDSDDLIQMRTQAQKRAILSAFEWLFDIDSGREFRKFAKESGGTAKSPVDPVAEDYFERLQYYIHSQYARRIIFNEPTLFNKSLGKVSFRDFFLSDDLDIEDCALFTQFFMRPDEFPLPWFKDSVYEGLNMMRKNDPQHGAANIGDTKSRVFILGGWIYNHSHRNSTSDEVWWHLFKMIGPQASTENRYVRLCDNYDDMIGMLSVGGLGLLPPPGFCKFDDQNAQRIACAARMHLSLSGVVTADFVSPQRTLSIDEPLPTTKRPQSRGNIVWADVESRGYLFGAVRYEKDDFNEAFLQELRSRPDLFQLIVYRQGDPKSKAEESGSDNGKALPAFRGRQFEAPPWWNFSNDPPQGRGKWETFRSANDVLFSTKKEKIFGYITTLEQTRSAGWFFHFKKFPVRYFVVLDSVPNRHGAILLRNVAWAALRAGGFATGELTTPKYYKASDKLFQAKAAQRLSWMDPALHGGWSITKMADSDDETSAD
ncbi:hypothetical protein EST38_g12170 [Candolleomyces aberdarensis]|uniref:Uncharacterized protein n=1 Tax=Candolleomyces aberdarensis TaxID=2316362 RepID=A0A4Q2D4K9_9AGAR|nr:hypothetical protein EST38_g12170 [Candolleomyces aberdarensis]